MGLPEASRNDDDNTSAYAVDGASRAFTSTRIALSPFTRDAVMGTATAARASDSGGCARSDRNASSTSSLAARTMVRFAAATSATAVRGFIGSENVIVNDVVTGTTNSFGTTERT